MEGSVFIRKDETEQKILELLHGLSQDDSQRVWEEVDVHYIQDVIDLMIRIYTYKAQTEEAARDAQPLPKHSKISDTEAMIFAGRLLEQKELDLFEVQMFRSLCLNA